MYVILRSLEGPYGTASRSIPLCAPTYKCRLGRTVSENEFRLDQDPEVSGHHATFLWNLTKDCLQIRDENSFNGTAINSTVLDPGKEYDVHNGSILSVGRSKFRIYLRDQKGVEQYEADIAREKQEAARKRENGQDAELYCPVCFHSLKEMTLVGRTQHVNNCLGRGNPEPSGRGNKRVEADGEVRGMAEPTSRRGGEEPDYITKAVQLSTEQQYDQMPITQLASLIQRMNDVKAKLEIQLQQARITYYRKRSAEILQQPSVSVDPLLPTASARPSIATVDEEVGRAMDIMFTQGESQMTFADGQGTALLTNGTLGSAIQSRLTGATITPSLDPKRRRTITETDFVQPLDESSDDSILAETRKTPIQTPIKQRRASLPLSPSRGIPRVTPRRSSILVSPTKPTPSTAISHTHAQSSNQPQSSFQSPTRATMRQSLSQGQGGVYGESGVRTGAGVKLSLSEREKWMQFVIQQIPADLKDMASAEIQAQAKELLSQSLGEARQSKKSMEEQLEVVEDENKRKIITILIHVVEDVINSLEMTKTPVPQRQGMSPLASPVKTLQRLPADLTSPSKMNMGRGGVSEDTVRRVKAVIQQDTTLANSQNGKGEPVTLERFVTTIRRSLPSISPETIRIVLDNEGIRYVL